MQLDRTQIAIRERDILEIMDLSLHICRDYLRPLLSLLILAVLPLMGLNYLLIGWMNDHAEVIYPFRYVWNMVWLVVLQAPAATTLMTAYLGQAVFDQRPSIIGTIKAVLASWQAQLWCVWILRGILPGILLVALLSRDRLSLTWVDGLILPTLVLAVWGVRLFRPFINEIVVLERSPLRPLQAGQLSIRRRSSMLHSPSSSVIFARSIVTSFFAMALVLVVMGGILSASGILLHDWRQGPWMLGVGLPLALWMVTGFFAVVRFLTYLDTRIRQEGWEVEIRVRAAATVLEDRLH